MADDFYLKHCNQEYGPMDANKLRQLATQNKIVPTDLIRRGTQGRWIPAANVKGLFPELNIATPPNTPIIVSPPPTQVSTPPLSSSMSFENLGNISADDSHRNAKHGPKRGKKKEPMDQKKVLIISAISGGVLLLLGIIALLCLLSDPDKGKESTNKPDVVQSDEKTNNSGDTPVVAGDEKTETAPDNESVQQSADGENVDDSASTDKAENPKANKSDKATEEVKTDLIPKNALDSTQVGKAGDLEIKITSVRRGIQSIVKKDGSEDDSPDKSTIITLSVKNVNAEKTVAFTPWSVGLSRGSKSAVLTDNNDNQYPSALKPGEVATGVERETATLYSDDPAVTDILVFKRYVPAAKELYLILTVPGNQKENIAFKIDVANIGKEASNPDPDKQSADEQADKEKAEDEKANDETNTDNNTDEKPAEDNLPAEDNNADNQVDDQADNGEDADYSELNGVSEEAQKREQEQADKELKELNLGDE